MRKVYTLDGVEVWYDQEDGIFEVWAMVSNGPDDFDWDVVETTHEFDWAIAVADEVWNRMETMTC
jgi:hypothetical protein